MGRGLGGRRGRLCKRPLPATPWYVDEADGLYSPQIRQQLQELIRPKPHGKPWTLRKMASLAESLEKTTPHRLRTRAEICRRF